MNTQESFADSYRKTERVNSLRDYLFEWYRKVEWVTIARFLGEQLAICQQLSWD